MRRGKVRVITTVALAVIVAVTLLPSAVLAHPWCTYRGPVYCCNNVTEVSAWLEDPYVGPWTATLSTGPYEVTRYLVTIPPDDPATPEKDGGVNGDTVHFMVMCNSTNITAQSADGHKAYMQGGGILHPLDLCGGCPLQGDVNMDGKVDTGDITKLRLIIWLGDPPTPCADVNHDGKVDTGDITAVRLIIWGIG